MLNPVRLFLRSLGQFARGAGPALVLAFLCLGVQYVLWETIVARLLALLPEKPSRPLEYTGPYHWLEDIGDFYFDTLLTSFTFFFHALVALIVTSWLLRRRAGFERMPVLRRAVRGAASLTGAAAIVFAAAFFLDDVLPATRYVRFDFSAAGIVAVWLGATALLLPARLMGHEPAAAPGFVRTTAVATLAVVPWFYLSEIVGAPLRHCRDCGGTLDGGLFLSLTIAAYLFGLTVSSAAVSAAACIPMETSPAAAPAA